MTTLHIFKSTLPSVNYIFGNGKPAVFQQGRYLTDQEEEVATLQYEIKKGHPHIFQDPAELTVESDMLDPMVALKAKVREQVLAELAEEAARAIDPKRDMGTSNQSQVKPASTKDIAVAAAGGSGAALVSSLANIKIGSAK
jgi:hypothetical protein